MAEVVTECKHCGAALLPKTWTGGHARWYCNPKCRKRALRERHYEANLIASRKHQRKYRDARRAMLDEAKNKPCVDCGIQLPPQCMDFDHVRGTKEFSIGNGYASIPLARVQAEIAKCDVRCPNCHRLRHFRDKQPVAA